MIENAPSSEDRPRRPLAALAALLVIVVLAVLVGQAVSWAAAPQPPRAFVGCKTAPQMGPRLYAGPPARCIDANKPYSAKLRTSKGDISVVFLVGSAPETVNNFIVLAVNGYFNGLRFFRTADWYVQNGDPLENGRGGPGYVLPDEPSSDRWTPGSLGMARTAAGVSGGQFFVTRQQWPGGDPTIAYNHFATVTVGFEIIGQLTTDDRILAVDVRPG